MEHLTHQNREIQVTHKIGFFQSSDMITPSHLIPNDAEIGPFLLLVIKGRCFLIFMFLTATRPMLITVFSF